MLRKIMSREELDRKRERNNKIIVVVLGLIMLLSSAGYFASEYSSGSTKKMTYHNLVLQQDSSGYWDFSIGSNRYQTRFTPLETENLTVNTMKTLLDYTGKPLYFGINGLEDINQEGVYELSKNLGSIVLKTDYACLTDSCSENYAVKNCSTSNIIIFQRSTTNASKVSDSENCVILEYNPGESELISDGFLFKILGV
jgi:hypothetical protein